MSEILTNAISAQKALFALMNERAFADVEWFKNGGKTDGATPELSSESDSGETDGDRAEQQPN